MNNTSKYVYYRPFCCHFRNKKQYCSFNHETVGASCVASFGSRELISAALAVFSAEIVPFAERRCNRGASLYSIGFGHRRYGANLITILKLLISLIRLL